MNVTDLFNTKPEQEFRQGITESQQWLAESTVNSPVSSAITRRILNQRTDLLKYGPVAVMAAIDDVADFVGDVEEIGSSDVSAWVAQVERMLKDNPPEAFEVEETRHMDSYEKDVHASQQGFDRPADHRGLRQELAHEKNNLQISINGRPWKVVPGRGYADSQEERGYLRSMQSWAERKSAQTGKKWTVSLTGAEVSESQKKSELGEVSTELLGRYKTAAAADAKKSDAAGNYKRGDKRFSGIVKATKKQFDNDLKKHGQYGVAEDFGDEEAMGRIEPYGGIYIFLEEDGDEVFVQAMYKPATDGSTEMGYVLFAKDGNTLLPQDLEVEEKYQRQGIAATMYDYVKSKGYKIRRSGQQTDAGAGFWDKHRPEQNVWEQGVAEGAGNIGAQIKAAYQKIYDQGDDAIEFAYNDSPIFAQYWDEYEGDLDSIIAEVDPSELQIILDELEAAAEDQGVAEGWKDKVGAAALASAMAMGAGAAHGRVTYDADGNQIGGLKPTATVTAPADIKPAAEAPKGFSKEYLQKAADPNRFGRYLISVERAQELLKQMDNTPSAVNEQSSTSSDEVESAITRRILTQNTDLLMKYGPQKVMQAIEEVAYGVGDLHEIGSSDISAWVNQVKQILGAQ